MSSLASEDQPEGSGPVTSILIVDDEPMVGELLHDMLGLLGYRTEYCGSPERALKLLALKDFDLVLSDYRMPFMTGQEFFRRATENNPGLAARIIFITGDLQSDETEIFLRSTGTRHLAKPFHFRQMKEVIERALEANAQLATA